MTDQLLGVAATVVTTSDGYQIMFSPRNTIFPWLVFYPGIEPSFSTATPGYEMNHTESASTLWSAKWHIRRHRRRLRKLRRLEGRR